MSITEQRISEGQKATLQSIATDLNNGDWDALYYATEEQIKSLIDSGRISEDFYSRYDDYQEEMRVMMNQAMAEFA